MSNEDKDCEKLAGPPGA